MKGTGGTTKEAGVLQVLAGLVPTHARIMLTLLFVAFGALFFRWFRQQNAFSSSRLEDWGHAYLVPIISLGMIWAVRKKVAVTPATTFWPGLAPLLCGIASYFFFVVGFSNHLGQGLSLVVAVAGATILLLGPAMFRWLFLPVAYLGFGITVSEQIMIKATFPLQAIAAKGAWVMLTILSGVFGYDVDREGNVLQIMFEGKMIPLNVAEQCSGMRMVVAFLALSAVIGLLSKHWWQRIALFLLATPVAVFLNIIRVGVLGLASLFSPALATGDAHMIIGMLLLVPGFGLFLACQWALDKMVQESPTPAGGAK
ncbi:MAG: exosortase/archaeosortase family protein [Phycisphaerales bacterium]